MSVSKTVTKTNTIRQNKKCRGATHHYSIHSPKHDIEFCKKCDAYVEVIDVEINSQTKKGLCRCCGSQTIKKQKKTWLTRVLKAGVRQHHNVIRDWVLFPEGCYYDEIKPRSYTDITGKRIFVKEIFTKKPRASQYVEIKYKDTVYEIQLKYLALFLEVTDTPREEMLTYLGKKISIKGYRITYPEEQEMDEKCVTCNTNLVYNLQNQILCPQCNSGHNVF